MKLKLISMLAGAVVFVVPFTSHISADAQPTPQTQLFPGLAGVELTPEQKNTLEQVRQDTKSKIEGILTAEQLSKFKATLEQGASLPTAFQSMALSSEQQTQLMTVMQSAKTKIDATLTPEQQQQIMENMRPLMQRNQ